MAITEARSDDQIKQQFPAFSWLLGIPEVHALLSNPDILTSDQFNEALMGTNWWRTTAPSIRAYTQLANEDPYGLQQQQQQKQAEVNDAYKSLGMFPDDASVQSIADQALKMHWTDAQLNDAIVSHANASNLSLQSQGAIQTSVASLKQAAANQYVGLDDNTATDWAKQIAAGEKKIEDFAPTIQSWAKNKFSGSADVMAALDRGETVDSYFAPYKTHIAQMMNTSASSVDLLNNPVYSRILSTTDEKTGQQRPMNYTEMDKYLRSTDQYDRTPAAIDEAGTLVAGLAKTMGKVA